MSESEPNPFSVSAVQRKRAQAVGGASPAAAGTPAPEAPQPAAGAGMPPGGNPPPGGEKAGGLPFDPARLVMALLRGWYWIPLAALGLSLPLGIYGYLKFQTGYSVEVQLIRREVTTTIKASQLGDPFKPHMVSVATVMSLMQAPKLLERVAGESVPHVEAGALLGQMTIKQEKDTDLIDITLKTKSSPKATADLANLYCKEVELMTGQMQSDEAAELDKFLREQLAKTDQELETVNKEMLDFRRDTQFFGEDRQLEAYLRQLSDSESQLETLKAAAQTAEFRRASLERELARQNPVAQQLGQARQEVASLRVNYTDDNPVVKDALDKVKALEQQLAQSQQNTNQDDQFSAASTAANDVYMQLVAIRDQLAGYGKQIAQLTQYCDGIQEKLKGIPEKSQHYAQIMAHQQSLVAARDMLAGRQHEAQVYEDNPPGLYRIFAPATVDSVEVSSRWKRIIIVVVVAMILGAGFMLVTLCGRELMNLRIVSSGDLRRTAGVAVAVRIPDLGKKDAEEIAQWRFRVWAQLLRQLQLHQEPRPVLAVASARAGEGKSFFLRQLRDAARDRRQPVVTVTNAPGENPPGRTLPLGEALAEPDLVVRHWRENPLQPLDLVFDGEWRWTLENRARWQRAVETWQRGPGFTLLVELPPVVGLDVLLFAEQLPVVVWFTASGGLQQSELAATLELVEAGGITLAAAILNREPALLGKLAFLQKAGLLLLFAGGLAATAQPALAGTGTNVTEVIARENALAAAGGEKGPDGEGFSFSSQQPHLAPWQERLEIGPGDTFSFYLFGKEGTIRNDIVVGPDGRLSYLEAQSVPVVGLTVDEMRAKLDGILARYYKNPRTVAIPREWRSKKYFILGAVTDRGAYILDRPMTIIEAVARARGIATGLYEHNTVELADMPRAFLVRKGKRVPVDFDRLFNKGDLSQNILVEPGDYMYFPSGTVNEVYLLGAVANPGPLGLTGETTLVGLLTLRGGFLPKAYQRHVLVVRGSLQHPQALKVDVQAILTGRAKDFLLQPKDIIYVAEKPWAEADQLAQTALNSFVQSMTTAWAGNYIGPIITHQVLPPP